MTKEPDKQVQEAKKVIEHGGIVIFPTETCYGIAADALDKEAIDRVYEVKQRPRDKGLTVIVPDLETAERYARLSEEERRIVKELMPGPLTLVAEKKDSVPDALNDQFAFRISPSEVASKLAETGPIVATSANISGNESSYRVEDIDPCVREAADHIIDAGELEETPSSTVAEVNNSRIVIHRRGPVDRGEIEEAV